MRSINLFRAVRPYLPVLAVIATSAMLVFAIYFTELGLQWTTFLAGLLVASILAEASRTSRSEWMLVRRTAQLSSMKDKLEHMTRLHEQEGKSLAEAMVRLRLMDETIPTMVALIDSGGRCRYHNRAFRKWIDLSPERIDDRLLRDIVGSRIYANWATAVRQSLDGQAVNYEQTYTMPNGAIYRLAVEHVPQYDGKGKVTGFYMLANDLTGRADVRTAAAQVPATGVVHEFAGSAAVQGGQADQDSFIDSLNEQISGKEDAGKRILAAIENSEFSLYCQLIVPLETGSGETGYYEILIRLKEEEQNMMPPGAFFPLAEKHGLMPQLDRWMVQHILQRLSIQNQHGIQPQGSIFFINVAKATICDPEFPAFLAMTLREYEVAASALCFEVTDSELALATEAVAEFVRQVRRCGCHVALSGFGRNGVSFNLIRGFQVEFLKIDGSVILNVLRDPVELAKVAAIAKVAKKIGVRTIAEMVESEEAIARLREVGVDFAQGFGISRPQPLAE